MNEQYVNNAESTLAAAITAVDTTITLADATAFPATGNFRLKVNSELMLGTARTNSVITVTRGVEGTVAAAHASTDVVSHVLTAQALTNVIQEYTLEGIRPAPLKPGRLHVDNHGLGVDQGNAWSRYGPLCQFSPTFPAFTWKNQGTATVTDDYDSILLSAPAGANSWNIRARAKSRPVGDHKLTVAFASMLHHDTHTMVGIGTYNTADDRAIYFRIHTEDSFTPYISVTVITDFSGAGNGNAAGFGRRTAGMAVNPALVYLQIEEVAGQLIHRYSNNGRDWIDLFSTPVTSHLGVADGVFFALCPYNNPCSMRIYSWSE